jgi:hypothetical protein
MTLPLFTLPAAPLRGFGHVSTIADPSRTGSAEKQPETLAFPSMSLEIA